MAWAILGSYSIFLGLLCVWEVYLLLNLCLFFSSSFVFSYTGFRGVWARNLEGWKENHFPSSSSALCPLRLVFRDCFKGSPSLWLLIGFSQWVVATGSWRVEEKRAWDYYSRLSSRGSLELALFLYWIPRLLSGSFSLKFSARSGSSSLPCPFR